MSAQSTPRRDGRPAAADPTSVGSDRTQSAPLEPAPSADDRSVSMLAANLYAPLVAAPLVLPLAGAFALVHAVDALFAALAWPVRNPVAALLLLVAGVVVHEAIHGVVWKVAGRKPWSTIRFGFDAKTLTPYAHCTEPMPAHAYRLGVVAPGVALGVVPAVAAVVLGSASLAAFGLFFTVAASGDALLPVLLRGVAPSALVADHPSRVGAMVFDETSGPVGDYDPV